jgi:hypothetical protein
MPCFVDVPVTLLNAVNTMACMGLLMNTLETQNARVESGPM